MGGWGSSLTGPHAFSIHGPRGTLLWGYREVAGLRMWRIHQLAKSWVLTASLDRANVFEVEAGARCHELHFTAPRDKGRWCWPVMDCSITASELRATLGQPLQ